MARGEAAAAGVGASVYTGLPVPHASLSMLIESAVTTMWSAVASSAVYGLGPSRASRQRQTGRRARDATTSQQVVDLVDHGGGACAAST